MSWDIFFNDEHRVLAETVRRFAAREVQPRADEPGNEEKKARELVRLMAEAGLLRYVVPQAHEGVFPELDLRSLCIIREGLAYFSGLADTMFALQGLGSYPITLAGKESLKHMVLPRVAHGQAVAAFAVTEPDAGSDVAAMQTSGRRDRNQYVLSGTKTFISNAGIADFYIVFAKTDPEQDRRGISAFFVEAATPGCVVERKLELVAPHPIGVMRFEDCCVPRESLLGAEGEGFKIAMKTLDVFRTTVAAAALGMARRALDEAIAYSRTRIQFGRPLAEFQGIQFKLAEMASDLDAARLLVHRAAWKKDQGAERVTLESAMAKLYATEAAQRIIDEAVQIHGGCGVVKGYAVERLYREVRALRIYEGTSEIQKVVIARELLKETSEKKL
jgi:acyl-CoA dehydrogenase